jgi:hypothetical protein
VITNCTVTAITPPGASDQAGKVTFPSVTTIDVRAAIVSVTTGQRIALGATIEDATAVVLLQKSAMPAGVARPDRGCHVVVRIDEEATAEAYVVEHCANRQKSGGLAHYEAFVRKA